MSERAGGQRPPGLSATLAGWLEAEPLAGRSVLDVGTGTGRLGLWLAPRAGRVVGIDVDAAALVEARRQARRGGLSNMVFVVADAETADYRMLARPDAVVAHLCVSAAIVSRASEGLEPEGLLAFAAFHVDQWRETGRVSRFALEPEGARRLLVDAGFRVERLEVERWETGYPSVEAAREATRSHRARWEADGRWAAWERYLADGGRTLTESRLVALARRAGPAETGR